MKVQMQEQGRPESGSLAHDLRRHSHEYRLYDGPLDPADHRYLWEEKLVEWRTIAAQATREDVSDVRGLRRALAEAGSYLAAENPPLAVLVFYALESAAKAADPPYPRSTELVERFFHENPVLLSSCKL